MIKFGMKFKWYEKKIANLVLTLLAFSILMPSLSSAGGFEVYKACFVDLPGWQKGKVEGMSMNYAGMNMVSANTQYTKGAKELQVSFTSGAFPGMTHPNLEGDFEMETSEGSVKMKTLKGKTVTIAHDKQEDASTVSIILKQPGGEKDPNGAMLNFVGTKMKPDEVLKMAERFDWNCFEKKVNGQ